MKGKEERKKEGRKEGTKGVRSRGAPSPKNWDPWVQTLFVSGSKSLKLGSGCFQDPDSFMDTPKRAKTKI